MNIMGAALLLVGVFGVEGQLDWSDDYSAAKEAANAEKTPLLVVLENPAVASQRFDDNRLASNDEQLELLKRFRLCRIDVTTTYGKRVAKAFKVRDLPYVVLTDKSANYITLRKPGPITTGNWEDDLLAQLNRGDQLGSAVHQVNRFTVSDPNDVRYDSGVVYEGIVSESTYVPQSYATPIYDENINGVYYGDSYGGGVQYSTPALEGTISHGVGNNVQQMMTPSLNVPALSFPSLQQPGST